MSNRDVPTQPTIQPTVMMKVRVRACVCGDIQLAANSLTHFVSKELFISK